MHCAFLKMTSLFRLPVTDITATMNTHQNHDPCCDFEMRFIECMEAYGIPMGDTKCKNLLDDLTECSSRKKQWARVEAMRAERRRQVKNGESQYAESPVQHVYKDYTFYD